jgi:hypothetical protein
LGGEDDISAFVFKEVKIELIIGKLNTNKINMIVI